jgi:NAD(P)-dependent dehydrogenase (short-subunit alcohol dehydrogenase family)
VAPVALVTGGSRGIGAATAVALAAEGWNVAISYRSHAEEADHVVAQCRRLGRQALAVRAELSGGSEVEQLFAAVDEGLGRISGFVNNAGVVPPAGRVDAFDEARLRDLLAINVVGATLAAGAAVRRMSTAHGGDGGVIVNVSSRAAVLGSASEYVDYASSKAAIDALTVGLAGEVGGEGIRVVGVRPGLIETDIHAAGRLARLGSTPLLGRPGTAGEVASAIVWLMSAGASYVTGTTLDVSGGR